MGRTIDLIADVGENFGSYRTGDDERILSTATSANVACGFHAGDPRTMEQAVSTCAQRGVGIGAHPGFPELVGFGRRAGGGSIVNLSSGGGTRAHRGLAAYDASKGGVEALTRTTAIELAPYGIRVNTLVPGLIATVPDEPEWSLRRRDETVPLGRGGDAEDLAGPALFLVSDDAAYVTGTRLVVDGGVLVQQRSPQVDTFKPEEFPAATEI
jgi:NAD(P)-dependent dehydrogenase (short-subunit alcohol dehydrogenase family)